MADPNLSKLLKWSVENTSTTAADPSAPPPRSGLDQEALRALFSGGPSDADLMISSMQAITSEDPDITVEDKMVAFDNFEQLVENLDNSNNIGQLKLWEPLLGCLKHEETKIRLMAAWCIGTAIQNNLPSQEQLNAAKGLPLILGVALDKKDEAKTRAKAVRAISSAVRNFQPAMDDLTSELAKLDGWKDLGGKVDAADMEAVDVVINRLRAEANGGKA